MTSQRRAFLVHCLFSTLVCSVIALKCNKLVTIAGTPTMIFTEGIYAVYTTLPTNSTEIRQLAALLQDSNGMEFVEENFSAIL